MDQDIKKRWTDALRSGEYSQDRNWLATSDGYCCLGVLCEIAVQDGVVFRENGEYFDPDNPEDISGEELPQAVVKWAALNIDKFGENPISDIEHPHASARPERPFAHLSELNDDMDYDFNMIATVIDRVL